MRRALLIIPLCFFPLISAAHPGKTDHHGGHQCLKDCAEWDLYYREYHTHDKDGKAIRITRKKPVRPASQVAQGEVPPVLEMQAADASAAPVAPRTPVVGSVVPAEPDSPVLPWFLVALLLLLLLSVRRRERKNAGN